MLKFVWLKSSSYQVLQLEVLLIDAQDCNVYQDSKMIEQNEFFIMHQNRVAKRINWGNTRIKILLKGWYPKKMELLLKIQEVTRLQSLLHLQDKEIIGVMGFRRFLLIQYSSLIEIIWGFYFFYWMHQFIVLHKSNILRFRIFFLRYLNFSFLVLYHSK